YGAMDGAMKFVKGDAIAGIVITTINIIGGFIIGMGLMGMTAGDSARTFSLLFFCNGLLYQNPPLFIVISSGIFTTPRSSEKKDSNLGSEISQQIMKQPKAIMIAAGIVMGLGVIPGFPMAPFTLLASGLGLLGYAIWSSEQQELAGGAQTGTLPGGTPAAQ